ncbi:hypothetical protein UFOVP1344_25 [uncultured Caudovirales phage]|uniref:Uncharacterized protein n=1 Tax=uncultured Caudovirales phage TaxID=2100421 RepID=A0A6J5Q7S8_9CAUD|nr:hypothetical protein UFOVP1005_25 [uncultured Caudovirales phage]CAB4200060.1 hypothetical protein UFOVP1344_25 [uncultured Caudovirales phage]CAB4218185.1 hypothetical protein UFOVP1602_15 [uncultured Caudovirales phage]
MSKMSDLDIMTKRLTDSVFAAMIESSSIEAATKNQVWFDNVSLPLSQIMDYLMNGRIAEDEEAKFTVAELEGLNEPPTR